MITADALRGVQIAHKASLDAVYAERDLVLSLAAKLACSHPMAYAYRTTDEDPSCGEEWRGIVVVMLSGYFDGAPNQLMWHYHSSEAPLFEHLSLLPNAWDGHSTEEKYDRLRRWVQR